MASGIPCDARIAEMSQCALRKLFDSLSSTADRERLSDALLRIHRGWQVNAHSETSDTRRRRRMRREITGSDIDLAPANIDDGVMRRVIHRAAEAGLTDRQRLVWYYSDIMGWPQHLISAQLQIQQPAVSKLLNRAHMALLSHIDLHSPEYRLFVAETHRSSYFKQPHRPALPIDLDAARQLIERDPPISTHIQIDNPRRVELWRDGDPMTIRRGQRDHIVSLSFRQTISRAKKR